MNLAETARNLPIGQRVEIWGWESNGTVCDPRNLQVCVADATIIGGCYTYNDENDFYIAINVDGEGEYEMDPCQVTSLSPLRTNTEGMSISA